MPGHSQSILSRRDAMLATTSVVACSMVDGASAQEKEDMNDSRLVAVWRRFDALQDRWLELELLAEQRPASADDPEQKELDQIDQQVEPLIEEMIHARATTPAGFLCKIDLAIHFFSIDEHPDDYPLRTLRILVADLAQFSKGIHPRSLERHIKLRSFREKITGG